MRLNVESLLQAPESLTVVTFSESVDFPADLGALRRPLAGRVTVTRSLDDHLLTVQGHLSTLVELVCDRCVGPVSTEVEFDLDESLEVTAATGAAEEVEEAVSARGELDLSDLLRQHLLLNLPSRSWCGCEPAYLSEHKRIDPRWRQLENLLSRSPEEEP